jgi:hypothetical protein
MADAQASSRAKSSGGDIELVRTVEQGERNHFGGVGGVRQEDWEAEGEVLALIEHSHGGAGHVEGQRQLEADCSKKKGLRGAQTIMASEQCTGEHVKQMKNRLTVRHTWLSFKVGGKASA